VEDCAARKGDSLLLGVLERKWIEIPHFKEVMDWILRLEYQTKSIFHKEDQL
jgi:hypothetical protein